MEKQPLQGVLIGGNEVLVCHSNPPSEHPGTADRPHMYRKVNDIKMKFILEMKFTSDTKVKYVYSYGGRHYTDENEYNHVFYRFETGDPYHFSLFGGEDWPTDVTSNMIPNIKIVNVPNIYDDNGALKVYAMLPSASNIPYSSDETVLPPPSPLYTGTPENNYLNFINDSSKEDSWIIKKSRDHPIGKYRLTRISYQNNLWYKGENCTIFDDQADGGWRVMYDLNHPI